MPETDPIAQAVAKLFDFPVGVGVTDPRAPQPDLWGGEDIHLARAVPKRCREFAAGRAAARRAMEALGLPPQAVLPTLNHGPVWPMGLHGSISHSDSLCVAVVTQAPRCVGLDAEPATPLPEDLIQEVVGHALTGPDAALQAKRIFSAKEAAFKAQFPVSKTHFGFNVLDMEFDVDTDQFTATFATDLGPFTKGDKLLGRHTLVAEHFVTAVSMAMDA